VTKSKFSSEAGSAGIDVDDPLFWQKVMPDFVTPEILLKKLSELEEALEKPVKGRPSKDIGTDENDAKSLSRGRQKKVNEFMIDLKGVMEDLLEQEREGSLPPSEKATAQTLLLTISVKSKLFNQHQMDTAKKLLHKLEGDRRRKCRTVHTESDIDANTPASPAHKELLIVRDKKKRRSRGPEQNKASDTENDEGDESDDDDEKEQAKTTPQQSAGLLDGDGFKKHSDDEGDWSDVDEELYKNAHKKSITLKETTKRRQWGAGKDAVELAGMKWPVFPRHALLGVMISLMEEVIKIDKEGLGLFSVPVPKLEFPEYYELVKNPMDYGTMNEKLEKGEYRSLQYMQKDFVLVMQNCIQFNAQDSDIVLEAQRQTLMRPKLLKEAALKNNLFICEDGSILEVRAESKKEQAKKETQLKRKEAKKTKQDSPPRKAKPKAKLKACGKCEGCKTKACKKCDACKAKKRCRQRTCLNIQRIEVNADTECQPARKRSLPEKQTGDDKSNGGTGATTEAVRKPRIRIRVSSAKKATAESNVGLENEQEKKRKATPQKTESARKKPRRSDAKTSPKSNHESHAANEEMFNVKKQQSEYDELDGSFASARQHLIQRGPWRLPRSIESKFKDVAKMTLCDISKFDAYGIFKEPVNDKDVPGYGEIITNPMDFGTMLSKVEEGNYGTGSDAAAKLYEDFLLVFDNCNTFNDGEGDVFNEAISALKALPLTFAKSCQEIRRKRKRKR